MKRKAYTKKQMIKLIVEQLNKSTEHEFTLFLKLNENTLGKIKRIHTEERGYFYTPV